MIATLRTRLVAAGVFAAASFPHPSRGQAPASRDGQHDFDFEIGTWVMHRRSFLPAPAGNGTWVETDGDVHIVRSVWGGRAALGELKIQRPTPHFAGSMMHLYDPRLREWRLYWMGSDDGTVAAPMIGRFDGGRGEFFAQEAYQGSTMLSRLTYSDITPTSFRTETAYSGDGGRTWTVTEVDTYAREGITR